MNQIFIYARPCVNKMTWAFFFYLAAKLSSFKLQCSFLSLWNMEETSEELTNFCIGIDLLGPDATSSKNNADLKKLASCAFRKLVGRPSAANFGWKTFTGNRTDTNCSSTTFKGKIYVFMLFLNLLCTFVICRQSDWSRKISLAITAQITQEDIDLLLTKTTAARSSQEAVMTSQCS